METISVGITHYNRTEFIEEAITPLLKDDRVGEIVIVDDFSDDYGELLKIVSEIDDTNKVNIFRNSNNMGAFKNNIITAKHCQKPWIILMDSDNIIEKDYIDVLYKLHSWDPDIIYCPDWAITFPEKPSSPFLNYTIYDNQKFHIQDIKKHHLEIANFWSFLNNGNYFINREAYLRVYVKIKISTSLRADLCLQIHSG